MAAPSSSPRPDSPHYLLAQEIKEKIDIVEFIRQFTKISGKTEKQSMAVCPFHDDKDASMSINPKKGFFYCHGCQANGTVVQFHQRFQGLEFREAVDDLAQKYGLRRVVPLAEREDEEGQDLALLNAAGRSYHFNLKSPEARGAVDYMKSRGLTVESIRRFMIGYGTPKPRPARNPPAQHVRAGLLSEKGYEYMSDRMVFPIRDEAGVVRSFAGRILQAGDTRPKYMNGPETPYFSKTNQLFGLYESRATLSETRRAVVVEGYFDVVMLHQHGVTNAVAAMGTALSAQNIETLFRRVDEIVLCLDPDKAGIKGILRAITEAAPVMQDTRRLSVLLLPPGQDPDEYVLQHSAEQFKALLDHATPASTFVTQQMMDGAVMRTSEGRAAFRKSMDDFADLFVNAPHFRRELRESALVQSDLKAMASLSNLANIDDESAIEEELIRLQERAAGLIDRLHKMSRAAKSQRPQ